MNDTQYIPYDFAFSIQELNTLPPDEKARKLLSYWQRKYNSFRKHDVGMYSKKGLENHMQLYHEAFHAIKYWENTLGG